MLPNKNVLTDLGYPIIQNWLKEHCQSDGAKILANEYNDYDYQDLINNLDLTQEIINSIDRKNLIYNIKTPIISKWIELLRIKGSRLSKKYFNELYNLLNISLDLNERCDEKNFPKWHKKFTQLFLFEDGQNEIKKIFNDDFEIKDSASPQLKKIRGNINQIKNQTQKKLNSIFQKAKKNNWLNNDQLVWKDDRAMLPIDATHKRKIKGIIHSYSSTKQTAFIEPIDILEDNNKLTILYQNETNELNKILIELGQIFHPYVEKINTNYGLIIKFDYHLSKALFAKEFNCCRPLFNKQKIEIQNGKNPNLLLSNKNIVDLNCLIENNKILLISGPNAGGKTVAIKSIGLFTLMSQQGLFVPAQKCIIPYFHKLKIDIGDRQSIDNDLSTFSAHIKNLISIIKTADSKTLILLDELGSGTEPEAGSALSQSILEKFITKKSFVLATTHMSSLKLWANGKKEIINGGMIFNNKKLEPTFILKLGLPGSSFALEISDRLGLDKKIIKRAKSLMNKDIHNSDSLIEKLEAKNQSIKELEKQLNQKKQDIQTKENEILIKEQEVNKIYKNAKIVSSEKMKKDLIDNRKEIENLINNIKTKEASKESIKRAKSFISKKIAQVSTNKNHKIINKNEIVLNKIVLIPDFNAKGTIIEIDDNKNNVVLDVKGKKLKLNIDKIFIDNEMDIEKESKNISKFNVSKPSSFKIDLRGKRVDDALENVKLFLDQTYISGMTFIHIIHGKGTGALQTSIHKELKDIEFIKSYNFAKPENGGTGVTIVEFNN